MSGSLEQAGSIILSTYQSEGVPSDAVRYNVHLLSDSDTVVTGLLNQSASSLHKGDYVLLYRVGGKLSNSYILGRRGTTRSGASVTPKTTSEVSSTLQTANTDIYSCTFKSYFSGLSPWEMYKAYKE